MTKYKNYDDKITVNYRQYDSVTVRDLILLTQDELIIKFASIEQPVILWCNGVLFMCVEPDHSEYISELEGKGIRTFEQIIFTFMPEYKNVVRNTDNMALNVLDMSNNRLMHAITKWLKDCQAKEKS